MIINVDDASVMAVQQLSGLALEEVSGFVYALEAAPNLEALKSIYDDVEGKESELTFLAKTNEQHVAACVQVKVNQKGEAELTIKHYD